MVFLNIRYNAFLEKLLEVVASQQSLHQRVVGEGNIIIITR